MATSAALWRSYPPEQLLRERFGISTGFHPGQQEIIERLVHGERLLVIQRTGWGKSLCYQMASLYYPHMTVVFSPLKALMRDQCQRCNTVYKIPAAIVSSDFSEQENQITLEQAVAGQYKILFIAPERLSNALWQQYVYRMRISMIVVDEAHCISTWGHDFRPNYRRIVHLLGALPVNTPVLALTATANKRVEQDVLGQMGQGVKVVRGTMQRPNLLLHVVRLNGDLEKLAYLTTILPRWPGSGIVYVATRGSAEMVTTFLQQQGLVAEYYHAGREDEGRQDIEQKLMSNQYKVICSTNALGMGIDKPDIRFIVHYHVPASPINYYQEMGRAGRDGKEARCVLLYDPEDLTIQEHFIQTAKPEGKYYELVLSLLRRASEGMRESDILRRTGLSQTAIRNIFNDLEDQGLIRHDTKRGFIATDQYSKVDFSAYDAVRLSKQQELGDIQQYAETTGCYMGFVTAYLGDEAGYRCGVCGNCQPANFPTLPVEERIVQAADRFLQEEFLPRIERKSRQKQVIHEAGWSLSYHGTTRIGRLVRASKYEQAGFFPEELVERAVEVIRARYPVAEISAIVSVPPSVSGSLVENFARRVAHRLGIPYLAALTKVRPTGEQKHFKNRYQKEDNVKGAFSVTVPSQVANRSLLLIDDIYDSGYMLREVGNTLMQAGARAVYPLTITKTLHSDDQ
jgi:ATP-dependent DNA helicase RecQ